MEREIFQMRKKSSKADEGKRNLLAEPSVIMKTEEKRDPHRKYVQIW